MKNLYKLLTNSLIVKTVYPSVDVLLEKIKTKQSIKIFYGETFDEFGVTIDSLKYYFVLSLLHKYLGELGITIESQVVIADVASTINKSAQEKLPLLEKQVVYRLGTLNGIIQTFDLPITPVLMSDVFQQSAYAEKHKLIQDFIAEKEQADLVFPYLEKTVLQNRIAQERHNNFRYSLEAVATSLLFDIKLGPPREMFYDQAAEVIAQHNQLSSLCGIYLTPTYPLGKNFSYFLSHPEIEEFGLTPYKAGSNKLQDHRIILGKTDSKKVDELITTSFESPNPLTVHPVFDMYLIAQLANMFLEKKFDLADYNFSAMNNLDSFKKETIQLLNQFIFTPLKNGALCQQ